MKKFVIKVSAYVLVFACLFLLPCIAVDPYNVFHPNNLRANGVEPNKNFIKMKWVLANPDKFDTFIFGSSLAGALNPDNMPEEKVYNMTHSGALIEEHLLNLQTMIEHGIVPKKIYVGIDSICYLQNVQLRYTDRLRCPYEYYVSNPLEFYSLYFDPAVNFEAIKFVADSDYRNSPYDTLFYEKGNTFPYGSRYDFDQEEIRSNQDISRRKMSGLSSEQKEQRKEYAYSPEQLQALKEIVTLCDLHSIGLTVFVHPLYYDRFAEAVNENCFLSFMRGIADITPFFCFCGLNDATTNTDFYFYDLSHYLPELGDLVIDSMCRGKTDSTLLSQGFGVLVSSENIDEYINLITR